MAVGSRTADECQKKYTEEPQGQGSRKHGSKKKQANKVQNGKFYYCFLRVLSAVVPNLPNAVTL
jgi:hypothetical protein